MEKIGKKLLVVMMALVMVMSMGASVFAEGEEIELTVSTEGMFKPTAAKVVGSGADTKLLLTYASDSYDKLYLGTAKQAVLQAEEEYTCLKEGDVYTIPIGTTTGQFYVAAHSVKNQGWYNRIFTLDLENKTLHTETTGAIVPDDYEEDWDETSAAEFDFATIAVKKSRVEVQEDGTILVQMAIGGSRYTCPKLALVEQTATDEEKEAAAMTGTPGETTGEFEYEFTIDAEDVGKQFPISTYAVKMSDQTADWHVWGEQHYLTIKNCPNIVNQMIEQIQIQKNNEYTAKYIELSKKYWDALDDADKLEDDGYFSDDTGDASKDDPLNTAPDKDKELLVVSFGTSFNESRAEDIGGVEKALAAANPDWAVRRAFTAQIIINHVEARDGEKIDNMEQALQKAVDSGVKTLVVQPTHLMHGAEYDELVEALNAVKDKFQTVKVAEPLLGPVGESETVINSDKAAAAKALVDETLKEAGFESMEKAEEAKTAFVYMGHGTAHAAAITYSQMQAQMKELGYKNCFVGTVEGNPASTALPEVKKAVEAAGYTKIILRPMMVVAGDHANNDMAADEEGSWYYGFVYGGEFEVEGADQPVDIGEGFGAENVTCQIKGLGRIDAIQQMYLDHTKAAIDEIAKEEQDAKNKAEIAKVKAGKIKSFKAKAGKKKVTFTWKKNTTFAGYQLKYKAGKKSKTLNIKSAKTAKKIVKKLKKGTKVTAQIRGYKKIAGKTYYGKWAKSKAVKVK